MTLRLLAPGKEIEVGSREIEKSKQWVWLAVKGEVEKLDGLSQLIVKLPRIPSKQAQRPGLKLFSGTKI